MHVHANNICQGHGLQEMRTFYEGIAPIGLQTRLIYLPVFPENSTTKPQIV